MGLDQGTVVRILISERVKLFAYICAIVRDEHMAEDVLQEVSMLMLDKREELRDANALPIWLRRAARLTALTAMRRQTRRPVLMDESLLDRIDPFWDALDREPTDRTEALSRCVDRLTPTAREVLRLRYVENLSGQQLADRTGRKLDSVYMALSRIHARLADCVRRQLAGEARRA